MAKNITTENENSVTDFLNTIDDESKRKDGFQLVAIFSAQTSLPAKMWGKAIIGFGSYHYKYNSGHEGDAPLVAFSPRANSFALYLAQEPQRKQELLAGLGRYKMSGNCTHIKKLAEINIDVLKMMISEGFIYAKTQHNG